MNKALLVSVLAAFLALTGFAVWQHGYLGIFQIELESSAGWQVLADLVIALSLFLVWLWRDAKAAGRNPIPWTILILATGSIGALVYLIVYKTGQESSL